MKKPHRLIEAITTACSIIRPIDLIAIILALTVLVLALATLCFFSR